MGSKWKLALAGAIVTPACALLTPLDPLRGDGGAEPDATTDATTDAPATDGTIPESGDAALPPSAFCASLDASNLLLCEDWDQTDAAFFPNWTSFDGAVQRDDVVFFSSPFALRATTAANDSGAGEQAFVQRTFATSPSHVVFTFDARVVTADALGNYAIVNQVSIYTDAGAHTEYRVEANQTKSQFVISVTPDGGTAYFTLPNAWLGGGWHHVVMDLQVAATPATAAVFVDGNLQVADASSPTAILGNSGKLIVKAGIASATSPQTGWVLDVDNLVVQSPP